MSKTVQEIREAFQLVASAAEMAALPKKEHIRVDHALATLNQVLFPAPKKLDEPGKES
jgi:hypothetical protein